MSAAPARGLKTTPKSPELRQSTPDLTALAEPGVISDNPMNGRKRQASLPARRRLSEDVADEIQAEVMAAALRPGQRLPTEAEFTEQFGVSRSVVREATRILVQRGLVDVRPGRGMVVTEVNGDGIIDQYALMLQTNAATFQQLMEMRLVLETEISALSARRRRRHHLDDMRAALAQAQEHRADAEVCLEADLAFHRAVAQATGNPFFAIVTRPINEYLRRAYSQAFAYMAHQDETLREHQRIYDAIAARRSQEARAATRVHLERVMATSAHILGEEGDGASVKPA
jgi:GntR family transcriptional repressor for pyruvate dehydrogenase complex